MKTITVIKDLCIMDAGDFEISRTTGIPPQTEGFGGNKYARGSSYPGTSGGSNNNYGGGFNNSRGGYNNYGGGFGGNNRGDYGYKRY